MFNLHATFMERQGNKTYSLGIFSVFFFFFSEKWLMFQTEKDTQLISHAQNDTQKLTAVSDYIKDFS